jgi:hypothetical protein
MLPWSSVAGIQSLNILWEALFFSDHTTSSPCLDYRNINLVIEGRIGWAGCRGRPEQGDFFNSEPSEKTHDGHIPHTRGYLTWHSQNAAIILTEQIGQVDDSQCAACLDRVRIGNHRRNLKAFPCSKAGSVLFLLTHHCPSTFSMIC